MNENLSFSQKLIAFFSVVLKKLKIFLYFEIFETNDILKDSETIKNPRIFIKSKILLEIDKNFSNHLNKKHLIQEGNSI